MNEAVIITGKDNIERFRLATLIRMAKLEKTGLRRRGRSAYAILKDELGIKGNRDKVIAHAEQVLNLPAEDEAPFGG